MPVVGELVAGRMAQHVRMYRKRKLRRSAGSLNHSQEPRRSCGRASLRHEHVRARPLQWPQGPELRQTMRAFTAAEMAKVLEKVS